MNFGTAKINNIMMNMAIIETAPSFLDMFPRNIIPQITMMAINATIPTSGLIVDRTVSVNYSKLKQ